MSFLVTYFAYLSTLVAEQLTCLFSPLSSRNLIVISSNFVNELFLLFLFLNVFACLAKKQFHTRIAVTMTELIAFTILILLIAIFLFCVSICAAWYMNQMESILRNLADRFPSPPLNNERLDTPPPPYGLFECTPPQQRPPTVHYNARSNLIDFRNFWYVCPLPFTFEPTKLCKNFAHSFKFANRPPGNFSSSPASALTHSPNRSVSPYLIIMAEIPLSKVQVANFSSGDPMEWEVFKRNFAVFTAMLPATATVKQKKAYLLTHLHGEAAAKAADLYGKLGDDNFTLDNMLRDLTSTFNPAAAGQMARSVYETAKQLPTETIESWHIRLKQLYIRAYPDDDADSSQHLIRHYMQHLFHEEYRASVCLKAPNTYKRALEATQEVIAALSINCPKLAFDIAGGNLQANTPMPDIKQEINAISLDRANISTPRPQSPGPNRANNLTCFYCNTPGHAWRDCRTLNSADAFLRKMRNSRQSRSPYRNNRPFRPNSRSLSNSRRPSRSPGRNVSFSQNRQVNSISAPDSDSLDASNDEQLWNEFLGDNE